MVLKQTAALLVVAALAGTVSSCTQSPQASSSTSGSSSTTVATSTGSDASADTCKDFPVVMYPSVKSVQCERRERAGEPVSCTAFGESADSVEQITKFYQTQATGWTADPTEVQSSTHSVVTIKKGKAYASVVVNSADGGGARFQINAYPNGNDVN